MELKEKINLLSKIIDSYNKKILMLLVIAGGFGSYTIKFFEQGNFVMGLLFLLVFTFASFCIVYGYTNTNKYHQKLERIDDGN